MDLYILVYKIENIELYLMPDHQLTKNKNQALKFQNLEECKKYISDLEYFIKFEIDQHYFEENYLHK